MGIIGKEEYNEIWNKFYDIFDFKPSIYKKDWPTFNVVKPSITYDISDFYNQQSFEDAYKFYDDLHKKSLMAFRECSLECEKLYALDWHHSCYEFDPWQEIEKIEFEYADGSKIKKWPIEVLPNGDYYIFLASDFRWGILGHPWEKSMCVFGQELIDSFEKNKPLLFNKIIR